MHVFCTISTSFHDRQNDPPSHSFHPVENKTISPPEESDPRAPLRSLLHVVRGWCSLFCILFCLMSANASDTFSVTELCLSNTFRVTEFCFSNMNAQHTLQMTCTPSSCLILPQLEDACKQRTKNINTHTSHKHTPDHMHSFVAPHPTTAWRCLLTSNQQQQHTQSPSRSPSFLRRPSSYHSSTAWSYYQATININTHNHPPDHLHSFVAPHPTTAAQLEATTKQPSTSSPTSTLQITFIPSSPLILAQQHSLKLLPSNH